MKQKIKLGVSGDAGSFSEEAGLLYATSADIEPDLVYLLDMENVLAALEKNKIDLGIFPVVNFSGGLVTMAFEAMGKYSFKPIDSFSLDVHQCLLVKPSTQHHQIQKIYSHPQALLQCNQYLQTEFASAEKIEWVDTAKAANDLAQGILPPFSAVIAPERSAKIYDLEILAKNIQHARPNITIFVVVKKYEATNS